MFAPVAGLEPATSAILRRFSQLSFTGVPYIFISIEAHAGHYPCLRYFNIFAHSDIANLNPSVSSVNIRIPAAHSAFILSHVFPRPYTTTFLPYCYVSGPTRGHCRGRNLPRFFWLYLRVSIPSLSTPSALRSISMPFRLSATYRLSPWLLAPSVISTNDFAYLPGLLAARPSAFAEGVGFEPTSHF